MSHVLSPPLSPPPSLSPLAASDGGKWDAVWLCSSRSLSRSQKGVAELDSPRGWVGGGGAEQISPELNIIYENIVPSALPSCSQTAPFYGHLKTYKKDNDPSNVHFPKF